MIALVGGAIAIGLTPPAAARLAELSATLFPALIVSADTVALQALSALVVGVLAAVLPMRRAARVSIVNGLRALG